jgi:hypothetical protein
MYLPNKLGSVHAGHGEVQRNKIDVSVSVQKIERGSATLPEPHSQVREASKQ